MTDYFNDSPIESPDDDRFGFTPFAEAIAVGIVNVRKPIGTTIAINGVWGSGKSSAINLVRAELKKQPNDSLVVSDFRCWWYRGEEALALAFLQNLNSVLTDSLGAKVKGLVPKIGRGILQAGPVIGPAVAMATTGPLGLLASGLPGFMRRFFPKGDSLEKLFSKLSSVLEKEERRFLVIIDDIDRLSPEEALAVFKLIKSVGRLPNVIYLLAFDRALADKTVSIAYPSEGPHFLEKIIQASFELPHPIPTDLNDAVLASIDEICGSVDDDAMLPVMNNFYDIVAPYMTTPRHVARYRNAIRVTWPAIEGEVRLADFIALEAVRLYEPALFNSIRSNRDSVCGRRHEGDPNPKAEDHLARFLAGIDDPNREVAEAALKRLFPRLEEVGYGAEFEAVWDSERRVCIENHFDTYFRLALSDEALSVERISEIVARADDRDFIWSVFREAAQVTRRNGTSMVPVYLAELTTHSQKVERHKVEPLITALFEIHDEIDIDKDDSRGISRTDTSLRYHWLIQRLTVGRFTIEERTETYRRATQNASLGWLVDFAFSVHSDYRNSADKPRREDSFLMIENAVPEVVDRALDKIRAAAADRSLMSHRDLIYILYRWRDLLGGDATEVRNWTDGLLSEDEGLVMLAKGLIGETWSQSIGLFGMGDRVSKRNITARITDGIEILDASEFRRNLVKLIEKGDLDEDKSALVRTFLTAWESEDDKTS